MPATLTNAAEEVLVYLLKVSGDLQELVGSRITPDQLPLEWKDKDAIVYEQQGDKRQRVVSGAETGLTHSSFTVYCSSRSRGRSRLIAQLARQALAVNDRQFIADVDVCQVFVKDGERDESVPAADGVDAPERSRAFDVTVHLTD